MENNLPAVETEELREQIIKIFKEIEPYKLEFYYTLITGLERTDL